MCSHSLKARQKHFEPVGREQEEINTSKENIMVVQSQAYKSMNSLHKVELIMEKFYSSQKTELKKSLF